MAKAFVLLSGGIDSTTCLYIANQEFNGQIAAVSIDYGQRHKKEMEYAADSCRGLNIPHHVLDLHSIMPRTMLTDKTAPVPNASYADLTGVSPTYVPFRNGLMLSALTSFVVGQYRSGSGEWGIYFGAHAEDARAWAYPDCTPEFIGAMANAIYVGTYHSVRLHTPLQWLDKAAVIRRGTSLGVDWSKTWSCYKGEEFHCGTCPTCRARWEGFSMADVTDPTEYAFVEG